MGGGVWGSWDTGLVPCGGCVLLACPSDTVALDNHWTQTGDSGRDGGFVRNVPQLTESQG